MNSNRISDKNDDGILEKHIDFIVDSNQKVRGNLIKSLLTYLLTNQVGNVKIVYWKIILYLPSSVQDHHSYAWLNYWNVRVSHLMAVLDQWHLHHRYSLWQHIKTNGSNPSANVPSRLYFKRVTQLATIS
jgi:hypothetical protein